MPPSPNRLDEDISEIMQKEGSEDDSQNDDDHEQPSKRMRHENNQVWDSSEMFLVETPVSSCNDEFACKRDFNFGFLHLEQNTCIRIWRHLLAPEPNA